MMRPVHIAASIAIHAAALAALGIVAARPAPPAGGAGAVTIVDLFPDAVDRPAALPAEAAATPSMVPGDPPAAPPGRQATEPRLSTAKPAPAIEVAPVTDPAAVTPPSAALSGDGHPALDPGVFHLSWKVLHETMGEPWSEGGGGKEKPPDAVTGMLDAYVADLKAAGLAKNGQVDGALEKIRDGVEAAWSPSFDQIDGGPLAEAPGKWIASWHEGARRYGSTGSPIGPEYSPSEPPPNDLIAPSVLDVKDELEKSGTFTKSVATVVTVQFDGKGGWKLGKVESSGHPAFDDAALDALVAVLDAGDSPRPASPIKARWSLQADYTVVPPLPVVGFSFDLALQHFEVFYPLKKKVKHRMTLLAVWVEPPEGAGAAGAGTGAGGDPGKDGKPGGVQ